MKGQRVRIVAGSAGGLWIKIPPKFKSRPTQDRVKQAIFSFLGEYCVGANILDLYAGSGSLGIEALSRGGKSCIFIEKERTNCQTIKENLQHCGFQGQVICQDVERYLSQNKLHSTLVLLDPPYSTQKQDLSQTSLIKNLTESLQNECFIVWEHAKHDHFENRHLFQEIDRRDYGDTSVTFLKKKSEQTFEKGQSVA
jgi:16S rRNA (guanine966-N2)-methyltransferase